MGGFFHFHFSHFKLLSSLSSPCKEHIVKSCISSLSMSAPRFKSLLIPRRSSVSLNQSLYRISLRSMRRMCQNAPKINSTTFLRRHPNCQSSFFKRDYPGIVKPAFYKEPLCPGTNLKEILQAEKNHLKLYKDGLLVGLFTSSPKNKKTGELYHFISKEKIDGTVCPQFNADGSQNDEGQYLAIFKYPRMSNDPNLIGIKSAYQAYCDRHEDVILMLLKIHQVPNAPILIRVSKNDPMLFHENGQRDKDF
jgi:hypothetical protein